MTEHAGRTMLRLVTAADPHLVAPLRDAVVEVAARRLTDGRLDDVALVTSELVTNAVRHGIPGAEVTVELCDEGDALVLTVANPVLDGGPPARDRWRVADPEAPAGRGLGIVARLAPDVRIERDDAVVQVVVRWPTG